jgi:CzcA family heavy metal efflux pump
MIDRIIKWSLRQRLLVVIGAIALLVWGGWQAWTAPLDVFPSMTSPRVTVIVEAHGMAPEQVETEVTIPIETAVNAAPGVRRVRSTTGIGNAVVHAEFDWGTDIYRARQIVSERLQQVRSELPAEVSEPALAPITSVMGDVMFVALDGSSDLPASEQPSDAELRETAEYVVRRRLKAVEGVSQVIPIGGDIKQYQVELSPQKLASLGISIPQVTDVLGHGNHNISAGFYRETGREYLIYGLSRLEALDDIRTTPVVQRHGENGSRRPVSVGDLGEVRIGSALARGDGSYNGRDAVVIGIRKQPHANTLELTKRLDAEINNIQKSLPDGMALRTDLFRQANFIDIAIDNVMHALRDGSILVVLIILVFLANLRATAITVLAIPLSLLAAVVGLRWWGGTINTMTLGGMTIAVGALVDDAIVDVENIVRRLRENAQKPPDERQSALQTIFEASREVRSAIVFATLIITLVFLPLFFLSGIEGRLLEPLGLAYVISLGASLIVALTVTPALSSYLLPGSSGIEEGGEGRVMRWLKSVYRAPRDWAIEHWKTVTVASAVALGGALVALTAAGESFLPEFNEGSLTVTATTVPGTALETSDKLGERVEEILLATPEVTSTARRTGRARGDAHTQGVYSSQIEVSLEMKDRSNADMLASLRDRLNSVPGTNVVIGQPISHRIDHMLSGTRSEVAVKIFGGELHQLRETAKQIRAVMAQVDGVVDLAIARQMDVPYLTVDVDREAVGAHGLTMEQVNETIEVALRGRVVSDVAEPGQRSFGLRVRMEPSVRDNLETIRQLPILPADDGVTSVGESLPVPLAAVADIRRDRRPNRITREDVRRKLVVSCNVSKPDVVGVVEEIRQLVDQQVDMPAGYHVEYGGQFESAQRASRRMLLFSGVAIIGIFVLLVMALSSSVDAALVMVNLPLALIGGVVGVWVTGGVISIATLVGFVTLFGIAARNGLLMVTHIQHLYLQEGVRDRLEAVRQGAMERLAPILMTALASGLGLIPLALSAGEPGSEIQAPMAIVVLFGLVTSTALNMVVLPALYFRFGRLEELDDSDDMIS